MARIRVRWVGALAAAALAVPLGAATAYGSGPAGDWKQADHDASGNRANTTEATITPANAATLGWRRGLVSPPAGPDDQCGEGWSTPVIANKRVYAVETGRLTAHELTTGALVWQRTLGAGVLTDVSSVFAISSGRVFVQSLDCISGSDPSGSVRAFSATTGQPLWSQSVTGISGAAVSGSRVYAAGSTVGSGDAERVFDAASGTVIWERFGEFCGVSGVVVLDRVFYEECDVSGNRLGLVAARLADGAVTWRRAAGGTVARGDAPDSTAKHLYIGNTDVNPANGATRFSLSGASRVEAVDATRVYAVCGSVVCAFNRATGARVWTSSVPAATGFRPVASALAGALLYTAEGYVLNASTGAVVIQLWVGQASELSVGNGYLTAVVTRRVLDVYGLPGT